MSGMKGIVILTRFDFIASSFGKEALKSFQTKIQSDRHHVLRQPVVLSNEYPEHLLKAIDDLILSEYFNNEIKAFRSLGHWNAAHLLPKYFQLYIDNKDPIGFLQQMVRMRPILIGLGSMFVSEFSPKSYGIRISYGQPYSEAVKLSELGLLEEGVRLCGAPQVRCSELESDEISVEYQLDWD